VTEVTFRGFQRQKRRSTLLSLEERCFALLRWLHISVNISGRMSETTSLNPGPATDVDRIAPASGSLEWNLLLAASRADASDSDLGCIRALLEKPVDWEGLLRLADDHGTSPLLYQNLAPVSSMVPSSAMESLRRRYETNVHKSLFLVRELMRILDHLEGLGIAVIPYKGVVLSEACYGDIALRQSGDIDLFVRKPDVLRIKSALRDLGYTTRLVIPEPALEDYIASGYEWTFDSPAGPNLLELQWALQPRFYAVDYDMPGLFERAVNITVAGRRVKTPSSEDLLLVLSVHAAKHVFGRLIWLCDIAQILKRENLNWDWVQSRTRELGIERILRVTLLLANRFLATAIPPPFENTILADPPCQACADEIAAAMATGVSHNVQQLAYFRLMMRLRERPADRVRFLTRLTFTPGPGEWEAIRLPKALLPLYRVVRLVRLASRFARG
jgi:hypothetical protein